jgi:phage-related protein
VGACGKFAPHCLGRRIARLVFFVDDGHIGVVHGFIKKTQKTPQRDIDLANQRRKEIE